MKFTQSVLFLWLAGALVASAEPDSGKALSVEKYEKDIVVQTPFYRGDFSLGSGGILQELKTADGVLLFRSSHIYSDLLMDLPRKYFGSRYEGNSKVDIRRAGDEITVTSSGRFLDEESAGPPLGPIRYTTRVMFDRSRKIQFAVSIRPGLDEESLSGFLALTIHLGPQREYIANLEDGRICELAASRSRRTWQSRLEPLSSAAPWLGVVLRSGLVLQFRILEASVPLQNVFFHDSGKGPTSLFFAWLDGGVERPVKQEDAWLLRFSLEAIPLENFREDSLSTR